MDVCFKTWGEGQISLTVFVTFHVCLSCLALHPDLTVNNILINTLCNCSEIILIVPNKVVVYTCKITV